MKYAPKKWVLGMFFLMCLVLLGYFISHSGLFSLENLKYHKDALSIFVHQHYIRAVFIYIASYALFTTASLPGAVLFSLAGGFLFGVLPGTLFTVIAATTGATGSFLISRYFLGSWIKNNYGAKLATLKRNVASKGAYYLLALRLMGFIPFFLINILAGALPITLKTFILTTGVGIIPGSFAYCFAGQQLGTIESLKDIISLPLLGAFTLLGALALVPVIFSHKNDPKGL
ncbi:TVP38/TMEM64 family protein [Candidatus Dependentiae bacterium]|nr:TVP38/TMEM64 family protein [Candidatus Dependentiae bacterium]